MSVPDRVALAAEERLREASSLGPVASLHACLRAWFDAHKRDLPWRRTRDPYAIWVSEVMLQQTRVETASPYYERFLARFPNALVLAEAPIDDVLAQWSGLGYYRRARLLHRGAKVVQEAGGALPSSRSALREVPGIGPYTAGAVASMAFGEPVGLVDGNVARVLSRWFMIEDDMRGVGLKIAEKIADEIVDARDPGAWNQALMELGSEICTPRTPSCDACPVRSSCLAYARGSVARLPNISPKKKPVAVRLQALVCFEGDMILLGRRQGEQLFGGMWEPPTVASGHEDRREILRRMNVDGEVCEMGSLVHVLSHRRLTVDVVSVPVRRRGERVECVDGYDELKFFMPSELDAIGVSTLARKVLAKAGRLGERRHA